MTLRELCEQQQEEVDNGAKPETMIHFIYQKTVIYNPLLDETGRFAVFPTSYYGEAFTKSDFRRYLDGKML